MASTLDELRKRHKDLLKRRKAVDERLSTITGDKAKSGETQEDRRRKQKREHNRATRLTENEVVYRPREKKWDELYHACRTDLHLWLTEVFKDTTGLRPFGAAQRTSIDITQNAVLHGGRFCDAEPRAYVKTMRACYTALWSLCYGHRQCVPIFSCNQPKSRDVLSKIRVPLLANEMLENLFPSLVDCIRAIKQNPHRAAHQHMDGKLTGISYLTDRIVFPTIRDEGYSGGSLLITPVKSARGLNLTNETTGKSLRPDFFFLDDVQTDEVAHSETGVQKLVDLIRQVVLHLGGLHYTLAGVMTATCIAPDDVTETFINDPGWQSVRIKHLRKKPEREDLWLGPYKEIRTEYDKKDPRGQHNARMKCRKFYEEHREEMDMGAEVAWEWAYAWSDEPQTEISAIQHAYNILIDEGPKAFGSEVQNEPIRAGEGDGVQMLTVREICKKQGVDIEFAIPHGCRKIIAALDVQEEAVYWKLGAFGNGYTGQMIGYGVYPDQPELVEYGHLKVKLSDIYPRDKLGAQIYKALEVVTERLCGRSYRRASDNVQLQVSKCMIDRGHESSTIDKFCRESKYSNILMSTKGIGIGVKDTPMEDRTVKENEEAGFHYQIKQTKNDTRIMYVSVDTNFWKTKLHEMLLVSPGDPGCLTLYEVDHDDFHYLMASNYRAEYPTRLKGRHGWVNEWMLKPQKPDNHWFDTAVMILVGAQIEGIRFDYQDSDNPGELEVYAELIDLSSL